MKQLPYMLMITLCGLALLRLLWMFHRAFRGLERSRRQPSIPAAPNKKVAVSLFVPAWNDAAILPRCLGSLLSEMVASPYSTQLIVVAGGVDGSYDAAKAWSAAHPNIHAIIVEQSPQGKNTALNDGMKWATGDILVFIDADTQVSRHWLTELIGPIIKGCAAATTGCFQPFAATPVSQIFVVEQYNAQIVLGEGNLFGGGTIAVTREALQMIGGLPESVRAGVDWDLSRRLGDAGQVTRFVASARVKTEICHSWRYFWRGEVRWRRAWWVLQEAPIERLRALYSLAACLLLGSSPLVVVAMLIFFRPWLSLMLTGIIALWLWILGPNLVRLAAYVTGTRRLLPASHIVAYLFGAYLSGLALLVGVATTGRVSPHFKGQRSGGVLS